MTMGIEPSELPPAPKSKRQPSTLDLAARITQQTNSEDRDTPRRRAASTALTGICIVFVVAMIAVPHLDAPLHIALIAFVVAIPFLSQEILMAGVKVPFRVHYTRLIFFPKSLSVASWLMSSIGYVAVAVGFVAIVWHLWPLAALVLIGAYGGVFIATALLAAVLFIARLMKLPRVKKQRQRQK
jgi:hypothetical protein